MNLTQPLRGKNYHQNQITATNNKGKTNFEKRKTIFFSDISLYLFAPFIQSFVLILLRIIIFVFGSCLATSLIENKFTCDGTQRPTSLSSSGNHKN